MKKIERINIAIGLAGHVTARRVREVAEEAAAFAAVRRRLDDVVTRLDFDALNALCGPSADAVVRSLCQARDGRRILATAYLAHPLAMLTIAATRGLPLTLVFERLSDPFQQALLHAGVELICARRGVSTNNLLRGEQVLSQMADALTRGRALATVFDVPHDKGVDVTFLGHRGKAAYLYALAAHSERVPIPPVVAWLEGGRIEAATWPAVHPDERVSFRPFVTQTVQGMFTRLEQLVLQHPEQYRWNNYSFVTSFEDYSAGALKAKLFGVQNGCGAEACRVTVTGVEPARHGEHLGL